MTSREVWIRGQVNQYESNLVTHLGHCGAPGECAECEIMLTMLKHWSMMLGMELARPQHQRSRWLRWH